MLLPADRWDAAAFGTWLARERPDVVLTEEPEVPAALRRRGIRVPEELGVAFFHQERPTRALSGIRVLAEEVGRTAGHVLMRLIETNERGAPAIPGTTLVSSLTWNEGYTLRAA